MTKSRTRRSSLQRKADLPKIANLYLRGWTQAEIGREFNLPQQQISRDIQEVIKDWRESAIVDMDALKTKELEKLNALERQYWESWEKSLKDFKETTDTTGTDLIGDPIDKKVIKQRKRDGDSVYLEGIRKCIELRCKILGIEAPDKLDVSVATDQPIAIVKMDMDAL